MFKNPYSLKIVKTLNVLIAYITMASSTSMAQDFNDRAQALDSLRSAKCSISRAEAILTQGRIDPSCEKQRTCIIRTSSGIEFFGDGMSDHEATVAARKKCTSGFVISDKRQCIDAVVQVCHEK